jgi:hypothetical protein
MVSGLEAVALAVCISEGVRTPPHILPGWVQTFLLLGEAAGQLPGELPRNRTSPGVAVPGAHPGARPWGSLGSWRG